MWNRKKRRIEELEDQLSDALKNLVNVTIAMPPNVSQTIASVRKGVWHRVAYRFIISEGFPNPTSAVGIGDAVVEEEHFTGGYFDGTVVGASVYGWKGDLDGD